METTAHKIATDIGAKPNEALAFGRWVADHEKGLRESTGVDLSRAILKHGDRIEGDALQCRRMLVGMAYAYVAALRWEGLDDSTIAVMEDMEIREALLPRDDDAAHVP